MITPASRQEWRNWLEKNHASESEVWLVYYKKHTNKPTLTYLESVTEALCFGWIDGIKKRIDDERYMHRFTPRRPASRWSPTNIKLAMELIASGEMTEAGLAVFNDRRAYNEEFQQAKQKQPPALAPEFERALKANDAAWQNFKALAPSYRKNYIGWLQSAKRPGTREKRLREMLTVLEQGKKAGDEIGIT